MRVSAFDFLNTPALMVVTVTAGDCAAVLAEAVEAVVTISLQAAAVTGAGFYSVALCLIQDSFIVSIA
jgi:hypothetical protein